MSASPGKADLTLMLPVSAEPPKPDARVQSEIAKMPMPHGAEGWQLTACRDDKAVTLHAAGPVAVDAPHFYSESKFIQFDAPQAAAGDVNKRMLTLPLAADASKIPEKLVGLLAYTDAAGVYRGLKVDIPLAAAAVDDISGMGATGSPATGGVRFFAGVLATIVATPCSAPFLAPAPSKDDEKIAARHRLPVAVAAVFAIALAFRPGAELVPAGSDGCGDRYSPTRPAPRIPTTSMTTAQACGKAAA